jgi:hypothetical protein
VVRKITLLHDSSVGTYVATGYGLDREVERRVSVVLMHGIIQVSIPFRQTLDPIQPSTLWILTVLPQRYKRQGREANQSPSTTAEVKKTSIYTSTPIHVFMA